MIRMCGWHEKNFGYKLQLGEKDPITNKEVTHGMCDACVQLEAHWTGRPKRQPPKREPEGPTY